MDLGSFHRRSIRHPVMTGLLGKRRLCGVRWAMWALMLSLITSTTWAQNAPKPEYVLVLVPVAWSGTMDEFDRAANEQARLFIEQSEIELFADVRIVLLHDNLTSVSLSDDNLPDRVMRFALAREPGDRYIGVTDGDLILDGNSSVVGWTHLGGLAVICEASYSAVTAHELGHTFDLCDEYNYVYWLQQNAELGGCPNPYPSTCPQIGADIAMCGGMPADDGSPSIMGPAVQVEQGYNRPSLDHLHSMFESTFGTPVGPTPTLAPGVTPSPTPSPRPSPTPTPTPGPRTLLVSSDDGGATNLYVVTTNSAQPVRITTGAGPDVHGVWSPDGSQIVYVSAQEGPLTLYLLPADGGVPTPLAAGGLNTHPAWSPDGKQIAFASDRAGNWDIYAIHPDGSGLRQLTSSPADEDWPAWSPHGARLAFASDVSGDWEIYHSAYDPATGVLSGTAKQMTNSPGKDIMPAWSSDGRNLAFVSERDGFLQIYRMPLTADQLVRVTRNKYSDWGPAWLDGTTLLFQSFRNGTMHLLTIDLQNRTETRLDIGLENAAWPAVGSY